MPAPPAPALDHRRRLLRRMAQGCLLLMVLIVSLSAFMRHQAAGLGCSDRPACYGQSLRALQGGAAAEAGTGVAVARLAHRVVASVTLILVITMVLSCLATRPLLRREGMLSLALLVLALGLAGLGIVTPGSRLPAVAMGNLLGGFAMLAICARLAAVLGAPGAAADAGTGGALSTAARIAAVVLVAQIVFGAYVSASYAGLSCGPLAQCFERAGAGGWNVSALNPWQLPMPPGTAASNAGGALALLVHRAGSGLAVAALLTVAGFAWGHGRRRPALALAALLALQFTLGTVMTGAALPLPAVLLHNLNAALMLALLVRLR